MLIKVYNTNQYIFLDKAKFPCERHFYDELMRIQFNKTQVSANTVDALKQSLKKTENEVLNKTK